MLWTTFTYTYEASAHEQKFIVGTVDGCGYDSQLKCTICEARRPYHSLLNILRPAFRQLRQIRCTLESLRCLNPMIWQFFVDDNNDTTNYFIPCACAQGIYSTAAERKIKHVWQGFSMHSHLWCSSCNILFGNVRADISVLLLQPVPYAIDECIVIELVGVKNTNITMSTDQPRTSLWKHKSCFTKINAPQIWLA